MHLQPTRNIHQATNCKIDDTPAVTGEIIAKLQRRGLIYHPTEEQLAAVTGSHTCKMLNWGYCNNVVASIEKFREAGVWYDGTSNNWYLLGEKFNSVRQASTHESEHIKRDIVWPLEPVLEALHATAMTDEIDRQSRRTKKL
jgi:hypothetical protein